MELVRDRGSYRDRANRVYDDGRTIYRGLSGPALDNWQALRGQALFHALIGEGKLIGTRDGGADEIPPELAAQWAGFLAHDRIAFVSYPYEWSFGMLKDAALLQLELLERAIPEGWTLKDASAFNIQWNGARPVFIDIPSFEPYVEGSPWTGYRQFCMMFLYPLMLRAYRNIDYIPFLRSNLEGIEPATANRILTGFSRLRKGVLGHVYLHARMQGRYRAADLDEARVLTENSQEQVRQAKAPRHSLAMVLGTIQGLKRTVERLSIPDERTTWGNYDTAHSYAEASFAAKTGFVEKHVRSRRRRLTWDIGCNTGLFSRICAENSDHVIAIDGDAKAIERLYQDLKTDGPGNILPLIADLANISPGQGWRGAERKALDQRGRPDLVLCLALIHHIVISANIPVEEFIDWLHELGCDVILEHVGLEDDMTRMLLRNRVNQYADLEEEAFTRIVSSRFEIRDVQPLKGGHRKLYFLTPR